MTAALLRIRGSKEGGRARQHCPSAHLGEHGAKVARSGDEGEEGKDEDGGADGEEEGEGGRARCRS